MATGTALVSGAGIAGATLAYWLARADWEVTVVERAAQQRSSGNPIDVRGDAASVLREMGLWPRLSAAATSVGRLQFVDAAGRPTVSLRTRRSPDPERELEVSRSVLAAALLDASRERISLVEGDSVTTLMQDGGGVDVGFERGGAGRFDLVVGADGLHSAVRRIAFGAAERFARPFGMFVGTMRSALGAGDPREVRMLSRPGTSLAAHPGAGEPGVAFLFRSDAIFDRKDPNAPARLVREAFRGGGWISDAAVAEWEAADDVYFDAVTRIAVPRWHLGRIALLGDAADCVTLFGEGSSNAVVGAKMLADAVAAHRGDPPTGLAAYERTHRRRVRRALRGAGAASRILVPATPFGVRARDAALRVLPSG